MDDDGNSVAEENSVSEDGTGPDGHRKRRKKEVVKKVSSSGYHEIKGS